MYFYEIIIIRVRYFATKLKLNCLNVIYKVTFWVLVFTNCQAELVHSDKRKKYRTQSSVKLTMEKPQGLLHQWTEYIYRPFYFFFIYLLTPTPFWVKQENEHSLQENWVHNCHKTLEVSMIMSQFVWKWTH